MPLPSVLADQLTLAQRGGQIMPTTLLCAPLDFSVPPTALNTVSCHGFFDGIQFNSFAKFRPENFAENLSHIFEKFDLNTCHILKEC